MHRVSYLIRSYTYLYDILLTSRERTAEMTYTHIDTCTETQLVRPLLKRLGKDGARNHSIQPAQPHSLKKETAVVAMGHFA